MFGPLVVHFVDLHEFVEKGLLAGYHTVPNNMDPGNIIDSFLSPDDVIPFEFLFNDHFLRDNRGRSKGLLGRAAEEFLAYQDEASLDKLLYTVDQFWISSRNRSWKSKSNPSKACGFIHGLLFFAQYVQQARLEIYRHDYKGLDEFFLAAYSLMATTSIPTIWFNRGGYEKRFDTPHIRALPGFDQDLQKLGKSAISEMVVQLQNNGRDFLENLFENANNITTDERLRQAFSSYLASVFDENAFALIKRNVEIDDDVIPKALYQLGPRATVKALIRYSNHFHINANYTLLEGGDEDDFFEFISMLQCGRISGSGGNDTIKLNQMISDEYELIINAKSIRYKPLNGIKYKSCVKMDSIERVVGIPNTTETIYINDCSFDMISLNGGTLEHPDKIYVLPGGDRWCDLSVILKGPSYLENNATELSRRFFYRVSDLSEGNITILLHAYWFVQHTFVLDVGPLYDLAIVEMINKAPSINEITVMEKLSNCLILKWL
uniref:Uncharacterized protein n=1 Tax=Romanomermis culicivorax TaxID=13658 RepID=A0A915IUL2_ROMCU